MSEVGGFLCWATANWFDISGRNSSIPFFLIKGFYAFEADELAAQRQIASHQFAPGELLQQSHQDPSIPNVFEQVMHGSWRIALGAAKCEINSLASAEE